MTQNESPASRWPEYEAPISPTRRALDHWFLGAIDASVRFFGRHWLALVNLVLFLYVAVPALAPLFMLAGLPVLAQVVYGLYYPLCHQLPYRSFFIGGQQFVYTHLELWSLLDHSFPPESHRWFIGNPDLGYKIALCQRDTAIYGSMMLAGLVFALVRRRYRSVDWRLMMLIAVLASVPMAVDGTTQLFGLRESVWQLRLLTGGIFGVAWAWVLLSFIEKGARQAQASNLRWEPAPGVSHGVGPPNASEAEGADTTSSDHQAF